jgi:hypothetical protein
MSVTVFSIKERRFHLHFFASKLNEARTDPFHWKTFTWTCHAVWTCSKDMSSSTGIQHRHAGRVYSMDMQHVDMQHACRKDMQHWHGHEHWHTACTCSKDMKHGHLAWTCSMFMLHGHPAWTCSMEKQNGHAALTFRLGMQLGHQQRQAVWAYSKDMHSIHAGTCSINMQHGHAAWKWMRGHAAWKCIVDMKHGHEIHAAQICSMDM